jgi:hypothetical protein
MFNVKLQKPSHLALQAENPFDRLGMEVNSNAVPNRLLLSEVDKDPRKRTPVAYWNETEERRAHRGEEERHASFALLPGDRLRSVNDVNGKTAMLAQLLESADYNRPKAVDLAISRNLTDVLAPSPERPVRRISTAPAKLPRLADDVDAKVSWSTRHGSGNSRASTAVPRSRSCSKSQSRTSCATEMQLSVSLSNAGRFALAF